MWGQEWNHVFSRLNFNFFKKILDTNNSNHFYLTHSSYFTNKVALSSKISPTNYDFLPAKN